MIQQLEITSRTQPNKKHTITIDTKQKRVKCNCKAFQYHKRCGHIQFYKQTIKKILENNNGGRQ